MDAGHIVDTLLTTERLKRLPRIGWLMATAVSHTESVAAHSWGTVWLSLLVADSLQAQGVRVDIEKVLIMATIHDLPEARISDIPHTTVVTSQLGTAKRLAEDTIIDEMLGVLDSGDRLKSIWYEFQNAESDEAQIVHAADLIDMLAHAISLEDAGVPPSVLHEFFTSSALLLQTHPVVIIQEIYKELFDRHLKNARRMGLDL